jgi:hypothetical protein
MLESISSFESTGLSITSRFTFVGSAVVKIKVECSQSTTYARNAFAEMAVGFVGGFRRHLVASAVRGEDVEKELER